MATKKAFFLLLFPCFPFSLAKVSGETTMVSVDGRTGAAVLHGAVGFFWIFGWGREGGRGRGRVPLEKAA